MAKDLYKRIRREGELQVREWSRSINSARIAKNKKFNSRDGGYHLNDVVSIGGSELSKINGDVLR
jgi:hypothetical protein